jgi:membrane associated rhomboid family serine protease
MLRKRFFREFSSNRDYNPSTNLRAHFAGSARHRKGSIIELKCQCGASIKLPDNYSGKGGKCASCKAVIRLITKRSTSDQSPAVVDSCLVIAGGPRRAGEQFFLGGTGTINLLSLTGKNVTLTRVDARQTWQILDSQGDAGASVNGHAVSNCELFSGDLVGIGEYELKFVSSMIREITLAPELEQEPQIEPAPAPASDAPDELYDFVEPSPPPRKKPTPEHSPWVVARKGARPERAPTMAMVATATDTNGPVCPSCDNRLSTGAKICVTCGIYVKSGRPLVTAQGLDENDFAAKTAIFVRIFSWFTFFNILPLASEAYGGRKPYAMAILALITTLISIPMFYVGVDSPGARNSMLWAGTVTPAQIENRYELLDLLARIKHRDLESGEGIDIGAFTGPSADPGAAAFFAKRKELQATVARDQLTMAAYNALSDDQKCFGQFHCYQLITNIFLHGGYLHLLGNLLFLYVFGGRVNALIGNVLFAPLYLVLGMLASGVDYLATLHGPVVPTIGASGAIMGLAGAYFVFFPVQRVFMVIWLRIFYFFLRWKVFRMRGFWLLVFWVGLNDVLPTVLQSRDHVAHWAHLGGFAFGAILALALLTFRLINAHGADILSVALGKHAWPILGKPGIARKTI